MISPELRFEGFDSTSWTNLVSLFMPGVVDRIEAAAAETDNPEIGRGDAGEQRAGTLVIVQSQERTVLKALHTVRGRVRDLRYSDPAELPDLTQTYRAQRAIVLREGVLEELFERVAVRLGRDDDYVTQWLHMLRAFRELEDAGLILVYPNPLASVPIPAPATVRRALDIFLPDEHALSAMLWDRGRPWTAVALRRRNGDLDYVAGPDLILNWTGPLGGDFRRDYRVVTRAIAQHVAPVHIGIYGEVQDIKAVLRNPDPGAWAVRVATRDVILHPSPPYVAVALSADALRAAATASARILGGLDVFGMFAPFSDFVRGRVTELASVTSTLGFNPLSVLATLLRRADDSTIGAPMPSADSRAEEE